MQNVHQIQKFTTASGTPIYLLPVQSFPMHITNCYLVLDDIVTLIDTGSGFGNANNSLIEAVDRLRSDFGESVKLSDVRQILITHAHIDHFGGINFMTEQNHAAIGVHELDANAIQRFHDQLVLSTKNLHLFLDRAGLSHEKVTTLLDMNKWSKDYYRAVDVDFTFTDGSLDAGGFIVHHTPGHCPGQVCLQLDDVLFSADHILAVTTPTQSPESISRYTGLGHYLESLDKIRDNVTATVALGGHEQPIYDIPGRIQEVVQFHQDRLAKLLELCDSPKNIAQLSLELFGKRSHYHVLLALLETGAHLEYLFERGHVIIANIDDLETQYNPVLLYQRA